MDITLQDKTLSLTVGREAYLLSEDRDGRLVIRAPRGRLFLDIVSDKPLTAHVVAAPDDPIGALIRWCEVHQPEVVSTLVHMEEDAKRNPASEATILLLSLAFSAGRAS